jgi:hypothetical protein
MKRTKVAIVSHMSTNLLEKEVNKRLNELSKSYENHELNIKDVKVNVGSSSVHATIIYEYETK